MDKEDIECIKQQCREQFEKFLDMYIEGFKIDRRYILSQFDHFNDPIALFFFPYFSNIYHYAEELFPNDRDVEGAEEWQMKKFKEYMKQQISLMTNNFADYMFHVLSTKTILNGFGIDDEK